MTDSHCHLIYPPISQSIEQEIEHFVKNGGKYILNVGAKPSDIPEIIALKLKLDKLFPGVVKIAFGIHPEFLSQMSYEEATEQIIKLEHEIDKNKKILSAVGECGLDYFYTQDEQAKEIQKTMLRRELQSALKHKLPVSLHCRELAGKKDCVQDILKIIAEEGNGKIVGSMHSYTGSADFVQTILDIGLFIGFNAIITYKSASNVRGFVKKVPLEKMLLETDAPWLPIREKGFPDYGRPSNVSKVAEVIAQIHGISTQKVIETTTENFEALFC